ncbi:MAG: DNA pilot protein [Microvirus sp.]|nr:MAG: DNA pilot protein [Microvirus sp.]
MPLGILGGTLLSAALKGLFDTGQTIAANKYNSPLAMRRRLNKAGLPLSYMYQGRVSGQSEVPQLSIEPTLGTVQEIQAKKTKQDTRIARETADNLEKENQIKGMMSGIIQPDGTELNNRATQMYAERDAKVADSFIKKYDSELKKIELDVEKGAFDEGTTSEMKRQALEKAKQQVKNLLAQAGLMGQLKNIRDLEEQMNKSLSEDLENMPDFVSSLLKIILIATKRRQ